MSGTSEDSYLTFDGVLQIYKALVEDFSDSDDPIEPAGVRSEHLLQSAVARQSTAYAGVRKYSTVFGWTASLFYGLCNNHPFYNGNKRCALVALLVALDANGYLLQEDDEPLFSLVSATAAHELHTFPEARDFDGLNNSQADFEVAIIARWIKDRARKVQRGERPLPFRTFRRILGRFGYEFDDPDRGFINILKEQKNVYHMSYHGEGYEVTQGSIAKVRRALELDEKHGIDGKAFYNGEGQAGEFIVRYRRVLRDLADA